MVALSVVVVMDPCIPLAANAGPPEDFAQEILREFDFGVDYDFGCEISFGEYGSSLSVGSFNYDGVSIEDSNEGSNRSCSGQHHHHCRGNQPKHMYRIESMKSLCRYCEFLWPGPVRDLTYELSFSDCISEFRDFFCMPLSKVEKVTGLMKQRGYMWMPRSLSWRCKFDEHVELLVMSTLHILGMGATFRCY